MNIINPYRFAGAGGDTLNNNLISFWKLQEVSGTRVDEEASGNDLDDINTVTQSVSSIVYTDSARFTASNSERLRITDATQTGLGVTGSFTVCAWVEIVSFNENNGIFSKWDGTTQRSWSVFYRNSTPNLRFAISNDGVANTNCDISSFTPVGGTFYHICARYDSASNEVALILDGGTPSTATFSGSVFDSTADFSLGYSGFNFLNGKMEACGFWDRALTNAEVTRLADETDSFYAQY